MKMRSRQQVALLCSQGGGSVEGGVINRLTPQTGVHVQQAYQEKCQLPPPFQSHVLSWKDGEAGETMQNKAKPLRREARVSPTHRHSRGTGRLPPPGTTAARTHTSRRPPRSRCTPTLRRRRRRWAAARTLIRSIQSRTVFYHLPVKWQLRLPVVAGCVIASWSYLLPVERDGQYNTDVSSYKKQRVHVMSTYLPLLCWWIPTTVSQLWLPRQSLFSGTCSETPRHQIKWLFSCRQSQKLSFLL